MVGVLRAAAAAAARQPFAAPLRARAGVPSPPLGSSSSSFGACPRCRHMQQPVRWAHANRGYKDQRERQKKKYAGAVGGKPAELYDLLGVDITATVPEIKDGFLKQVRIFHPDINPNPDANEVFDRIKSAVETLSDPQTRKEYDATTCGVQPDWVYGVEEIEIPLAAMTEAELQRKARYLDERITSSNANISALGEDVVNAGGVQVKRLAAELETFMEQRKELRVEIQKINATKLRNGGNRGRKKASDRLQTASTEWWDVRHTATSSLRLRLPPPPSRIAYIPRPPRTHTGRARASRRESEAGRRCCGGDVAVCDRWLWRCCCVGRCSARLRSTGRESTSTSGMTSAPSSAAANGTARLPQSQRRLRLRRERGRATMGRTGAAGARRVLGLASSSVSEPAHPLLLLHCRCRITRLTTSACREAAGGLRRSPPIGTPI